jgi:hypothetical protein
MLIKWLLFCKFGFKILILLQEPLFYAQQECDEHRKSQTRNTDVLLDANHTHFILVDDGSEGQFGKEIEFRGNYNLKLFSFLQATIL